MATYRRIYFRALQWQKLRRDVDFNRSPKATKAMFFACSFHILISLRKRSQMQQTEDFVALSRFAFAKVAPRTYITFKVTDVRQCRSFQFNAQRTFLSRLGFESSKATVPGVLNWIIERNCISPYTRIIFKVTDVLQRRSLRFNTQRTFLSRLVFESSRAKVYQESWIE